VIKKSKESDLSPVLKNMRDQQESIINKLNKVSLKEGAKTELNAMLKKLGRDEMLSETDNERLLKIASDLNTKENPDAFSQVDLILDPYAKDVLEHMQQLREHTAQYLKENPESSNHIKLLSNLDAGIANLQKKLE
jgi:hypothetical protein